VSRHRDGPAVGAELRDIALALIDAGYEVEAWRTHIHVTDENDTRIDVFSSYFDANDEYGLAFGIAGNSVLRREDWQGVREIDFPGGTGVVPVNAEQMVEHLYGADWRQPKPGFHWPFDRTRQALDARMTEAMREEIYWATYYARHAPAGEGSPFFALLGGRPDTPRIVIDIGCGDGRDSLAFAVAGRRVLGLDRSRVAITVAQRRAKQLGVDDQTEFRVLDAADQRATREAIEDVLSAATEPVLFYLRFFLHSIPEDVQEHLLEVISGAARPGDVLAAEFRTDRDEELSKTFAGHYRRYQNGPAFGRALSARFRFRIDFEQQGTGLSPFGDEDPDLYRVIAARV
jgi:SAM-dependent methyltransferase